MYAQGTLLIGAQFIQGALKDHQSGMTAEEIVEREISKHRGRVRIMGYARPITKGDERLVVLENYLQELGFQVG